MSIFKNIYIFLGALLSPENHFSRYSAASVLCGTGGGSLSMAKPPNKRVGTS
jgi:hypothetical protein